ncbi:hypothetical protein WJX79_010985 [Trebouxia sp. C0005]
MASTALIAVQMLQLSLANQATNHQTGFAGQFDRRSRLSLDGDQSGPIAQPIAVCTPGFASSDSSYGPEELQGLALLTHKSDPCGGKCLRHRSIHQQRCLAMQASVHPGTGSVSTPNSSCIVQFHFQSLEWTRLVQLIECWADVKCTLHLPDHRLYSASLPAQQTSQAREMVWGDPPSILLAMWRPPIKILGRAHRTPPAKAPKLTCDTAHLLSTIIYIDCPLAWR